MVLLFSFLFFFCKYWNHYSAPGNFLNWFSSRYFNFFKFLLFTCVIYSIDNFMNFWETFFLMRIYILYLFFLIFSSLHQFVYIFVYCAIKYYSIIFMILWILSCYFFSSTELLLCHQYSLEKPWRGGNWFYFVEVLCKKELFVII